MSFLQIWFAMLAVMSPISFLAYGWDKRQARQNGRRVPEKTRHSLDAVGGLAGPADFWLSRSSVTRHRKDLSGQVLADGIPARLRRHLHCKLSEGCIYLQGHRLLAHERALPYCTRSVRHLPYRRPFRECRRIDLVATVQAIFNTYSKEPLIEDQRVRKRTPTALQSVYEQKKASPYRLAFNAMTLLYDEQSRGIGRLTS